MLLKYRMEAWTPVWKSPAYFSSWSNWCVRTMPELWMWFQCVSSNSIKKLLERLFTVLSLQTNWIVCVSIARQVSQQWSVQFKGDIGSGGRIRSHLTEKWFKLAFRLSNVLLCSLLSLGTWFSMIPEVSVGCSHDHCLSCATVQAID